MSLPRSFASELLMLNGTTSEHWRHLALLNYSLVTTNKPGLYSFLCTIGITVPVRQLVQAWKTISNLLSS